MHAVHSALDEFVTSEEDRSAIVDAAVSAALPTSPGEALRLAGEIPDPLRRLQALQRIATNLSKGSQ